MRQLTRHLSLAFCLQQEFFLMQWAVIVIFLGSQDSALTFFRKFDPDTFKGIQIGINKSCHSDQKFALLA